jgi:hypothetical protein
MQLTYNGHPLYYYDDDHGPGTTAGQGESSFGANWYLLTPAGLKIDADSPAPADLTRTGALGSDGDTHSRFSGCHGSAGTRKSDSSRSSCEFGCP